MATLNEIEQLTKTFADAHANLSEITSQVNAAIDKILRKHIRTIRRRIEERAGAYADLEAAIDESPDLFKKPRTVVFHGIKVGLKKGVGKVEFDDKDQVLKLIRKHIDEAEVDRYIVTTEEPAKKALAALVAAEPALAKKLGISITNADDQVVITPTDSDVERLVKTLRDGAVDRVMDEEEKS